MTGKTDTGTVKFHVDLMTDVDDALGVALWMTHGVLRQAIFLTPDKLVELQTALAVIGVRLEEENKRQANAS